LSKDCRKLMVETGSQFGHNFEHMSIVASNDINEPTLRQLNQAGHQINVFGIGTNLVTCQAQPALGMVYKVVEFQGTPRMKFSEEIGKITLPGGKSVMRVSDEQGAPMFDLLCLRSEEETLINNALVNQRLVYFTEKKLNLKPQGVENYSLKLITKALFANNQAVQEEQPMKERRQATLDTLQKFGGVERLVEGNLKYNVFYSQGVYDLFC
jgi:nicotinate phosphoribosyltransferase